MGRLNRGGDDYKRYDMKKDKLRVIIIAGVIVLAVVAGILGLKIEPAKPSASGEDPAVTENVSNSPGNNEKVDVIAPESSEKPQENDPEPALESDGPQGEKGGEKEGNGQEKGGNSAENPQDPGDETAGGSASKAEPEKDAAESGEEKPEEPMKEPVTPDATPAPSSEPEEKNTCFVEIRCDTVMDTSVIENEAVIPYLPADGVVLAETEVELQEGDSAFDVLNRVCRDKNIQMEFRQDGAYSGYYIEGINYLYEFDAGALSGWMYKVNEKFPNYGCSRYEMQPGDKMIWVYTTDLGRDVGDNSEW